MNKPVWLALSAWFALGSLDLATGFVEFSWLRAGWLVALAAILLPWDAPKIIERTFSFLEYRRGSFVFLAALTLCGYALFWSRYFRGANMADDAVFREVIENSARGCWLCYSGFGGNGSYFIAHNNLFLLLFVPLIGLPGGWLLVHFAQSIVIVAWCRVCGWAVGRNSLRGWVVTLALFLATYTQHAAFYDTRFAALAFAVFAVGYYLNKNYWMAIGAAAGLLARETAGLIWLVFGLTGWISKSRKFFIALAILGLGWWIGSYALMFWAGGPIPPRFDACMYVSLNRIPDLSCVVTSFTTDAPLKLAYTLRLLRFAPTLGALPSIIAALPDLGLTWLSKDNVLYSLNWHYYMQTLGILVVGAGLRSAHSNLSARWIIASALWQFVTMFRFNLF